MEKVDFKKQLKALYQPSAKTFAIVDVPKMQFFKVDGMGDPNVSEEYGLCVQWLYSIAYPLKFWAKKELGKDHVVPPLEGLWWADDMNAFIKGDRGAWKWTMMVMAPDWVTQEAFVEARDAAVKKVGGEPPASLRLETFDEGLSVQIMHLGPYSAEAPTIAKLHSEFLPANGLVENGHHHEIYLNDPRRVAPEKLKTVLRQPVRSV
ncbi:MAG: GyrI-like domain-containing protein [Hyphomicrobiaceae bacterium]|nr:GyrI-like domain-containing protein [Hyphomicrobiaceae bacterium]MCC0023192.1 GyrI-like domain-containing protein [Hyphomicrobiaceae bacterium]